MSLIDFIQKIQRKPRYFRLQVLWLAVFICMFFIVSIWIVSLKHSLSDVVAEKDKGPLEKMKNEAPSLKKTLKASIGAFFEENLESREENIEQASKEPREIKPAKLPLAK